MRWVGLDVRRYDPGDDPRAQWKRLLDSFGIDAVLDVGASDGGYVSRLRNSGYTGIIISFEPRLSAFAELKRKSCDDPTWEVKNHALGNLDGEVQINVAGNYGSSSLLQMLPAHMQHAPASRYIGKETVQIRRLDSVFKTLPVHGRSVLLKIDTQGYEEAVLDGSTESLQCIDTIQIELSLAPLYEGAMLIHEMCAHLHTMRYGMVFVETGFHDRVTGRILQVDCIFHRSREYQMTGEASRSQSDASRVGGVRD